MRNFLSLAVILAVLQSAHGASHMGPDPTPGRIPSESLFFMTPAAAPFSTAVPNVPPAPILRERHLWSREKDKHLIWLIHQQEERWRNVAEQMPGRTARQCRERWINFLAPQIKNTPWSPEEDSLLKSLHNKYGAQWALISRMIEGRSAVQVKNRLNSLQKANFSARTDLSASPGISELTTPYERSFPIVQEGTQPLFK